MSDEEKKAIELMEICMFGTEELTIIKNLIDKQQKEIEEKTTILLAGAEKVKQLEKGNRSLMESRIKWKNRYYKEKVKNKDKIVDLQKKLEIEKIDNKYNQEERDEETIPKYKIREKIKEIESFDKAMHQKNGQFTILVLQGLLKEEDGDHIPRID